ncbi:hypothetical protein G9464_20930 [Halostella sp. JP-L12]|uniref:hypothetical protein n=1 Tax=Halostella TaxID=1843185 RepID=UPI000EF7DC2A|nr:MULTISPECIES: hypothetical protein [Halostella]NHN50037.1 hypothetical protein [Halostella sp. JP-L12]
MTLFRRLADLRRGTGVPDPDGQWYRTNRSLRLERWKGRGDGYGGDEVKLWPVDLGCRRWAVTTTTIDGDEEFVERPTSYSEAVAAAEEYMTTVARSTPAGDGEISPALAD